MATKIQLVFDAADPRALGEFWKAALGYRTPAPPEGFDDWDEWARAQGIPEESWNDANAIEDPDGVGPRIFIQRVPEVKVAKNRLHIDIAASGGHGVPLDERKVQGRRGGRQAQGARRQRRARRHGAARRVLGAHERPRGQRVLRPVSGTRTPWTWVWRR